MGFHGSGNKRAFKSILFAVDKFRVGINKAFKDTGARAILEIRRSIKEPPKTGRVYTRKGISHQASAPGEAPADLSGALIRSSDYKAHGWNMLVVGEKAVSGVDYPKFLEEWTRKMKPRPHVKPACEAQWRDLQDGLILYVDEQIKK